SRARRLLARRRGAPRARRARRLPGGSASLPRDGPGVERRPGSDADEPALRRHRRRDPREDRRAGARGRGRRAGEGSLADPARSPAPAAHTADVDQDSRWLDAGSLMPEPTQPTQPKNPTTVAALGAPA